MFFILLHLARGVTFFFPYSPTRGKQAVFPAALRCSFWRLSRSRVSAAVWLRWSGVRAEDECVCECVCYGEGDVSTWTRGPNSTLISNKSRRTAGSKRCRLLKDGFMPYEVWKMAFGSSRRRLPPRDSVTVAQEVQRLLASSSLSPAADANNEQTEIKLNIWPTL